MIDFMAIFEMASEKVAIDYIEDFEICGHLIMIDVKTLSGDYKSINININQYYDRISQNRNIKINKLLK